MTVLDYILCGVEEELALERELGVRTVECDRALLVADSGRARTPSAPQSVSNGENALNGDCGPRTAERSETAEGRARALPVTDRAPTQSPITQSQITQSQIKQSQIKQSEITQSQIKQSEIKQFSLAFLHDRALSAGGVEMMAKIIPALGLTAETAPIVFTGERPAAKVTVVLGGNALRKWFPGKNAAPGQWLAPDGGGDVLVTYSPEYILRFGAVTPAVMEIKKKMWNALKAAKQRTCY